MKTSRTILPLFFIVLSTVLVIPGLVPRLRAATGLVCIADQSVNPSTCPASPPNLTGPVGSVVTVAVNIQGSDSLNGFDISVQVNPSVLDPLIIMYNSSVLHSPNLVATQSVNSTTGIARLGLVGLGYIVTGPVTGNLFIIQYQVLSSTSGTSIVFQTGCSGTSTPNTCVSVVNASATDSESVQTATFGGAIIPDFSMTATPSSQSVKAGSTATSTIVLTSFGFAGTVNLSTSPPPLCPSCPTWSVSPSIVTLGSGGTGQAILSFVTTFGTPTTTFGVNVTGTSGNLSHHTAATFTVVPPPTPDFAIAANPSSQNVQSGSSATSTITLTSLNGFAGTINLFTSPQALCPLCPTWSLNPTSVTLASGGTAISILTFSTPAGAPAGTWVVNVTGTSGSLSHGVLVKFTIVTPDFTIQTNPVALKINQGAIAKSTVTLTSVNGFIGTVNLSTTVFPAGPTASIPPSIMLGSGVSNSTVLTVTTMSTTSPGIYNVTVTGTSGSITRSAVVSVQVINPTAPGIVCIAPDFPVSCPATPAMFTGTVGGQLVVAVNVQNSAALNGFDVQVLTNPSILKPVSDDLRGTVLQNLFVVQNTVNATTGLVRVAAVALGFVTTAPTTGRFFNITYNIVGSTPGTFILFPNGCTGTSNGNTCVTVVNAGVVDPENIEEANFTSTPPPNFTMSANPSSLAIQAGTSATSIISITSINGFAGTVSLATNTGPLIICPPACSTWSVSPTSVTLTPGGTATATLTIKVSSFGGGGSGFTVIVFGTSGSLSHSVNVVFTVIPPPTFGITANPSSVAVRQGQIGSSALNVTSLNGFNGTVTLSMSIQPLIRKGPSISLSTTTINLAPGGTATITLGIATNGATQLGTYIVTVTATSGSLIQTVTVTVTIIARR